MKGNRLLAIALVVAVGFCLSSFAVQAAKPHKALEAKGVIVAWDETGKTFKIKEHSGKEMDFAITEKTKITGTPAMGEKVHVGYHTAEGKNMAVHVTVMPPKGEGEAPHKPSPSPKQ